MKSDPFSSESGSFFSRNCTKKKKKALASFSILFFSLPGLTCACHQHSQFLFQSQFLLSLWAKWISNGFRLEKYVSDAPMWLWWDWMSSKNGSCCKKTFRGAKKIITKEMGSLNQFSSSASLLPKTSLLSFPLSTLLPKKLLVERN